MRTVEGILMALCVIAATGTSSGQTQYNAVREVSEGNSLFSSAFFQAAAEELRGNLVTSPFSLSMVLAMLAYGAAGDTEKLLKEVLHLPQDDDLGKLGYNVIIDTLNSIDAVDLAVANTIFVKNNYPVKPAYTEMLRNSFRTTPQSVDFKYSNQAADTINNWVSTHTNGRIPSIVNAADLSEMTAMVLVNAVYFKGKWKTEFNPTSTRNMPFYVDNSTENAKSVQTMYRRGAFKYAELPELKARLLEIPYKNEEVSMVIILPDDVDGLPEVERKLQGTKLHELMKRTSLYDVTLLLPKFTVESTINLEPTLRRLGLDIIFSPNANLSGIADAPLSVSKALQKAFIEVNEQGSEAAAATEIEVESRMLVVNKQFKAQHPFLFSIVHDSGTPCAKILFSGHVALPEVLKANSDSVTPL